MEKSHKKSVTAATLALMTVASVVSLRGLPMMAAEGYSMIFYILFAVLIFLLPAALVSAELGSAFSANNGGVYTWVKAAFGPRWGFTAIWLQWIQNVVWYPTVLAFAAGSLAYLFMDDALASNGYYTGAVIMVVYWLATAIALAGSTAVNLVTRYGVILGTLLPGILIIAFGLLWIDQGNIIAIEVHNVVLNGISTQEKVHPHFFPHFSGLGSIAFLAGTVLLFAGVEVQAVQAADMKNPARDFPLSMLLASGIIILLFFLGSFAIAAVIPAQELSLTAGLMQTFKVLFTQYHLTFLIPLMGLLMAFGAIGGVMSWVTGPSRGLLQTAKEGEMPPFMARTNKHGAPVTLLIIQMVVVTLLALLYFVMENVSVAFFVLSAMTVTLYLAMYMLMFAAALRLRYTQPDLKRPYKVPGGLGVMWLIAGIGFLGVTFALVVGFFPPSTLPVGNPVLYVGLVAAGLVVFTGMPLLIQAMKKPEWRTEENDVATDVNTEEHHTQPNQENIATVAKAKKKTLLLPTPSATPSTT